MNFISSEQVDLDSFRDTHWDCVFVASGFESRASHLVRSGVISAARKIAFGFSDRATLSRKSNDKVFVSNGFEIVTANGDSSIEIEKQLLSALVIHSAECFRILVDYSCMTREWYAGIINFCRRHVEYKGRVEITFCYSHSEYRKPKKPSPNSHVGPLTGFSSFVLPRCPTALIIGLGNESYRGLGIKEYVDAAETYLFYTDPCLDPRFVNSITGANEELFKQVSSDRIYKYAAHSVQQASASLTSLSSGLADRFRLILAPLGPKPFSLLCLLVALRLEGTEVWRVSSGKLAKAVDKEALGPITALNVVFSSQERSHEFPAVKGFR